MDKENQVIMSLEDLCQLVGTMLKLRTNSLANHERLGPFTTVDDRVKERWPLASKKAKRRIRDVCLGKYRQRLNRDPYKINGYANGTYLIEMEHIAILEDSIVTIRNEFEERERMPLFERPNSTARL